MNDVINDECDTCSIPLSLHDDPELHVTVKIENAYEDGHDSELVVTLPAPAVEDLDTWWDEIVLTQTGDGHNVTFPDLGSWYGATITAADNPALVDLTYEWSD